MTHDTETLHLIRIQLDAFQVYDLGRRRRLPINRSDIGYLLHCYLNELFGGCMPGPFAVVSMENRWVTLLCYGSQGAEELRSLAWKTAAESIRAGVLWNTFASKKIPGQWRENQLLNFEARVCPVIRKAGSGEKHRKGAEVDVFLAKCWEAGDPSVHVDRYTVYQDWFMKQVESGGVDVRNVRVKAFRRSRLLRRNHEPTRKSHFLERPDVTITGGVLVNDSKRFMELLKRGVGRHRNFGFGMLLLKPGGG